MKGTLRKVVKAIKSWFSPKPQGSSYYKDPIYTAPERAPKRYRQRRLVDRPKAAYQRDLFAMSNWQWNQWGKAGSDITDTARFLEMSRR